MKILFSERLRDLRMERGMSQSELGARLQTTQRKISCWESGKIEPCLLDLWKVAELFGVSADFLLGREEY